MNRATGLRRTIRGQKRTITYALFLIARLTYRSLTHCVAFQKEVERRRRETINDGINALRDLVPSCARNKGSILSSAAEYIQQLKDSEASNIEKWSLQNIFSRREIENLNNVVRGLAGEVDHLRAVLHQYHEKFGSLEQTGAKRRSEGEEMDARKRSRDT